MVLNHDKPLICSEHDKLGFNKIAERLATAFLQNDLSNGFVVGVEGTWGSGKSTLVNLALKKLEYQVDGPDVVRFSPWLVGSRDELLVQLFADLEPAILRATPKDKRKKIKRLFREYSRLFSKGAIELSRIVAIFAPVWEKVIDPILRASGTMAAEYSKNSLGGINDRIQGELKHIDRPILVFIDDLDRLDPCEVVEVLRLVKSVADFTNVAYILAYDPEVIANSVERGLGESCGHSYLEKIVQASFRVPTPLNSNLREWLSSEILLLLEGISLTLGAKHRLKHVIDRWGEEYLRTPRDVVRIVNSMKLYYVPVKDHVDPGDMVFLQIIRIKNKDLFNWVERYVANVCEYSELIEEELRETIRGNEKSRIFSKMTVIHFPALGKDVVYRASRAERKDFDTAKRLACPFHCSYYFSFDEPFGIIDRLPDY